MTGLVKAVRTLVVSAAILVSTCPEAFADRLIVSIGGRVPSNVRHAEVTATDLQSTGEAPAAVVVLAGVPRGLGLGAPLEVAAAGTAIFKGEIVSIEPLFERGVRSVVVRAFDRIHRLTRDGKTRVYEEQTDSDIVSSVAGEHGLVAAPEIDDDVTYARVAQHNQTDLEFLRARAARIGYEVFVDDTKLVFRRPRESRSLTLGCGDDDRRLRAFHPRMSSAAQVTKVTVRGWDPVTKESIEGVATRRVVPAGGAIEGVRVDLGDLVTLSTAAESHAIARAKLDEASLNYVSGEAATEGDPRLKPGVVVEIGSGTPAPFSGTYLVAGVQHRYGANGGRGGGYVSVLRLLRADRAFFDLPEVGDEVLVQFVGGDIRQPIVVGSLWSSREPIPTTACRPTAGGRGR